jgi:hypothetical protein
MLYYFCLSDDGVWQQFTGALSDVTMRTVLGGTQQSRGDICAREGHLLPVKLTTKLAIVFEYL